MNLRDDDDPPEEAPATAAETHSDDAPTRRTDTLDDALPVFLERDYIQLLLQSPHKLYLYWTFARDPHVALREAFGALAAHYRLAVRLIKVETGEEFLLDASGERAQWFEVYPRHVYRAEVGFHAPDRPFVRLLASDTVTTPPDHPSHLSDTEREFQLEASEFAQLLGGAGYERYAREIAGEHAGTRTDDQGGASFAGERPGAGGRLSHERADEYPHR